MSDITAGLSNIEIDGKPLANYDVAPSGMLDIQITNPEQYNLILIGRPSENKLVAQFLGVNYPTDNSQIGLKEGEAKIILRKNGDKVAVLVFGYDGRNTQRAAQILKDYQNNKDKLKGTEISV